MGGRSKADEDSKIHKYWNELSLTKHQFGKAMSGDFQLQMTISRKFCECFKGELGEWCTLRGPSGDTCRVRVTRSRKDSTLKLFTDGWPEFVKDNGIKIADCLLFSSAGAPNLYHVSIIDCTGCEREGAFFTRNSNAGDEEADESESEFEPNAEPESKFDLDNTGPCGPLTVSTLPLAPRIASEARVVEAEGFMKYTRGEEHSERGSASKTRMKMRKITPVFLQKEGQDHAQRELKNSFKPSISRIVSGKEIRRAFDKATRFEMANPRKGNMFVITLLPTHVYHGFHLTTPKYWVVDHMLHHDHDVKLRVPGVGEWVVSCRWTPLQCQDLDGQCLCGRTTWKSTMFACLNWFGRGTWTTEECPFSMSTFSGLSMNGHPW